MKVKRLITGIIFIWIISFTLPKTIPRLENKLSSVLRKTSDSCETWTNEEQCASHKCYYHYEKMYSCSTENTSYTCNDKITEDECKAALGCSAWNRKCNKINSCSGRDPTDCENTNGCRMKRCRPGDCVRDKQDVDCEDRFYFCEENDHGNCEKNTWGAYYTQVKEDEKHCYEINTSSECENYIYNDNYLCAWENICEQATECVADSQRTCEQINNCKWDFNCVKLTCPYSAVKEEQIKNYPHCICKPIDKLYCQSTCPVGLIRDGDTGECIKTCLKNMSIDGRCVEKECTTDANCTVYPYKHCKTQTNECIEPCSYDSDCANNINETKCDNLTHECFVPCTDEDCEKNTIETKCDKATGKCIEPCTDEYCEKNKKETKCDKETGKCYEPCKKDNDCSVYYFGKKCDKDTGKCFEPCTEKLCAKNTIETKCDNETFKCFKPCSKEDCTNSPNIYCNNITGFCEEPPMTSFSSSLAFGLFTIIIIMLIS